MRKPGARESEVHKASLTQMDVGNLSRRHLRSFALPIYWTKVQLFRKKNGCRLPVSDCIPLRALPKTRPRVGGFDLWRAKAGSNLLRPSVIRLHRSGRPAISVGIYDGPTGVSNESNQDIQADR